MPPRELTRLVVETSLRLIKESADGQTTGSAVVRALGHNEHDVSVYHAFQEAHQSGRLDVTFPGGMQLPVAVRRAY